MPGAVGGQQPRCPAARTRAEAPRRSGTPVTIGRWNSEPAVDRTTLGAWTSTEASLTRTASAPAASAAADHGAGVAGVADVGEQHQQAGPAGQHGVEVDVEQPAYGEQALRGRRVAHGRQDLGGHLVDVAAPAPTAAPTTSACRAAASAVR